MTKQRKILLSLTASLLLLAVLYFAVLTPLLNLLGQEEPPVKLPLLDGEAYYEINGTEYTDMIVMYEQLKMKDIFQVAVHNADGQEYLFYHYNDGREDFLYLGQYLDGTYDSQTASPSFYMPDIAESIAGFDYTTLYDGQTKIPALFSAVGSVVIQSRVYQWTEQTSEAEVQQTLARFGLSEADSAPWFEVVPYFRDNYGHFVYASAAQEGVLVCYNPENGGYYDSEGVKWLADEGRYTYDEAYRYGGAVTDLSPASDPGSAKRVYVGNATADDGGYYVMLKDRNVVYTTSSVQTNLAEIDLANVVNRSLAYYVQPRLLTASATLYDAYFTPSFKLQSGTFIDLAGEGILEGDKTYFSYAGTLLHDSAQTKSGQLLYTVGDSTDLLSQCLTSLKVGDSGVDLLSCEPQVRAVTDGQTVTYRIVAIDALFDTTTLALIGPGSPAARPVAQADAVLVSYLDGGVEKKGAICLADPALDSAVRDALVGKSIGVIESPADYIVLSVSYPKTDEMQTVVYKINAINSITRGEAPVSDTVAQGDSVSFTYSVSMDGQAVQLGSYQSWVVDVNAEDTIQRGLSELLVGKEKGTYSSLTTTFYFTDDACFSSYTVYTDCAVTSTAPYRPDLSFGHFYYVGGDKDIYQSDSIYLIEDPAELMMYSIDSSVAQALLGRFADLSGAETVAVGITEQRLRDYGLYAYHVSYTLPYNTQAEMGQGGAVESMSCDYAITYDLFISEKQKGGARYVASTQYDIITRVTDDTFDFVEWSFFEDIARSNLFMTNIEYIREIVLKTNYTDKKDTHSFVVSVDEAYGGNTEAHRLYVSYVSGVSQKTEEVKDKGVVKPSAGVVVEAIGPTLERVITVKNGTSIDTLYSAHSEKNGYDEAGVVHFRRFASALYNTYYMGQVKADLTEQQIQALLENDEAMLLSMAITLIDGRVYTFRFYAYTPGRMMVSVSGQSKDGTPLGESHHYYVNRSEVDKLATLADKLSMGQVFTENDGY